MSRGRRPGRPGESGGGLPESLPTLDLHGEIAEEARRRTEGWLRERRREAVRTVRVITGRGAHSPGPPVLRGEIEALLRLLAGSVVSEWVLERGGGAFRVELEPWRERRGSTPTGSSPRRPVRIDPEIRRRAEEALWELGIHPTPALLEAEIRRLRGE